MPPTDQTRLLLVEDVPQVAQYVRGLLNTQSTIKLLDVITDGSRAVAQAGELRPDVVIVDVLLQGRVKGPQVIEQLRTSGLGLPVIALTVPQRPVEAAPEKGVHGVLAMPFSGYDLVNRVSQVRSEHLAASTTAASKLISVFSPKGGVGKTTIAFNLAVALAQLDQRTVLIDGSLQFGDMRALLKVPADAPSILDLPTDRIVESDLQDVLWRDPSGIDILLAPPRIEMAEMVTSRDLEKLLGILRRVYPVVVVDMSAALSDINLTFLDASDTILELVTYDSTTIHNTVAVADAFRTIGYPPTKVQYLVNRADSHGGMDPSVLARAIGRLPEHQVVSDGMLVVQSNNEGVPFVLANPTATISQDIANVARALIAAPELVAARR